eukprot:3111540-Rhodomonas_salina.2
MRGSVSARKSDRTSSFRSMLDAVLRLGRRKFWYSSGSSTQTTPIALRTACISLLRSPGIRNCPPCTNRGSTTAPQSCSDPHPRIETSFLTPSAPSTCRIGQRRTFSSCSCESFVRECSFERIASTLAASSSSVDFVLVALCVCLAPAALVIVSETSSTSSAAARFSFRTGRGMLWFSQSTSTTPLLTSSCTSSASKNPTSARSNHALPSTVTSFPQHVGRIGPTPFRCCGLRSAYVFKCRQSPVIRSWLTHHWSAGCWPSAAFCASSCSRSTDTQSSQCAGRSLGIALQNAGEHRLSDSTPQHRDSRPSNRLCSTSSRIASTSDPSGPDAPPISSFCSSLAMYSSPLTVSASARFRALLPSLSLLLSSELRLIELRVPGSIRSTPSSDTTAQAPGSSRLAFESRRT